jgi:cytohesin
MKLIEAIEKGDIEAVKQHIAAGADVNANDDGGWAPLHYAALSGRKEIVELLIDEGADMNANEMHGNNTPLDLALSLDWPEIVDLLRKHGGKHGTILNAATGGDIEAVKEFLVAGADVNAKERRGQTPLHAATYRGHTALVELLIANDADVNALSVNGKTPLDWANDEIADLIRKHGGKHSTINMAAGAGNAEGVKEFLVAGADVNADMYGGTPLHRAAVWGHKEIVELLIDKGADVNVKDVREEGERMTPLDCAIYVDEDDSPEVKVAKKETADLLRKHGGKTGEELKAEGK